MKFFLLIVGLFILVSCSISPPRNIPLGMGSNRLESRFPESNYIVYKAQGVTQAEAEEKSLAQIKFFFIEQVNQHFKKVGIISFKDGNTENLVDYYLDIFDVYYALDTQNNNYFGKFSAVAYIDRNIAWQSYVPSFNNHINHVSTLVKQAENERDMFKKALIYIQAYEYTISIDFIIDELFGQIVNSLKMNEDFFDERMKIAQLPRLIQNTKQYANVYISCSTDFESMIYNAFSDGFNAKGFPVTSDKDLATAVCEISISDDFVLSAEIFSSSGKIDSTIIHVLKQEDIKKTYELLVEKVKVEFNN